MLLGLLVIVASIDVTEFLLFVLDVLIETVLEGLLSVDEDVVEDVEDVEETGEV